MRRNNEPTSRTAANNSRFAAPGLRSVATSQVPFDPTRDFSQSQSSQQQNYDTFRSNLTSNTCGIYGAMSRVQNVPMQNTVGQQEREFRSVFGGDGQRGNNGGNFNRVRSFGESLENENGITGRTNAAANTNNRGSHSVIKQRPEGQRLVPSAAAPITKRLFDGQPGPMVAGSIWDRDKATTLAQRQAIERAAQFKREKSVTSNSQSVTGPPAKEFYNAGADHYVSSQSTTVWTNNTQDSTNNTQELPLDIDRLVVQITTANSAKVQEALESLQRQLQTDFVDLLRECVGGFQQQLEGVLGEQSEIVTEKMQQLMDQCGAMQPGVKSLLEDFATKLEESNETRMGDVVKSLTAFGQRWTEQQEVLVESMFKKTLSDEFSADVASKVKNQIASPIARLSQKLQTEFDLLKQHSGQQLSSALSRLVDQLETRLGGKIRQSAANIEISIARSISRQNNQLETLISTNMQATTENTAELSNAMLGLKSSLKEAVVWLHDQKSAGPAAENIIRLEQKNASSQKRQDDAHKRSHCIADSPGSESETSVLSRAAPAKSYVAGGLLDDDDDVFSDSDQEDGEESEGVEEDEVEGMSEDESEPNPFDAFDFI